MFIHVVIVSFVFRYLSFIRIPKQMLKQIPTNTYKKATESKPEENQFTHSLVFSVHNSLRFQKSLLCTEATLITMKYDLNSSFAAPLGKLSFRCEFCLRKISIFNYINNKK